MPAAEQSIMPFKNAAAIRRWLKSIHARHPGIWMQLANKDSGIPAKKPETRERRFQQLLAMMKRGEKPHLVS